MAGIDGRPPLRWGPFGFGVITQWEFINTKSRGLTVYRRGSADKGVIEYMGQKAIQDQCLEPAMYYWGCGGKNEHGLCIKSYWDEDETVCTFRPDAHHIAYPGSLNGGIIATIIDCHCVNTAISVA